MHGREGENRKRSGHMWSVPTRGTTATRTVAADSALVSLSKDGRNISVGDCALFKPPQDSPPFVGIIRSLKLNKENALELCVNWLYRPTEVKLGKGIPLDAAPNEVFYSFHKDEIPAASLLHPCKVAFLPKGVELPSGISAFICRRVYDIANKCLWWLTDQDYIDERQEEVDQLLNKTRIQMHATVQSGGRSPKPINGPTSQLKPGSDNVQSSTFPSHAKGKKRERADHGSEPVKKERSAKMDDGDSIQLKSESLKAEISKITEKGGLVDSAGVEKLVQLMQPDRSERKMEVVSRSMLAGVIATTENFECLNRFVHLKGLLVLDEWLQDVHKGKIGDSSPKDGDKSVEDFLFVLLRALDKLPVNLQALQMCNIGKSVNHLRSHKNFEIQKRARSLVDTWKRRVEAEIDGIDAKSGATQAVSWQSRPRLPEVSHGGSRHPGGASDIAIKSSVTQLSASKVALVKPVQGELTSKCTSSSPGSVKSVLSPTSGKDGQPRMVVGGTSDLPSSTGREERSSSSSQSHNNSQSCSSDHAKTTVFSGKEDARSSTAGSMSVNKTSGNSSRNRRSVNGFPGPAASGGQRETGSNRSSPLHRNTPSEKISQSGPTSEKALDVPFVEGNSHKLIVKLPNRGRSPAQSASGGSFDDHSIRNSRGSSPVLSEKVDKLDRNPKEKSYANRVNTSSDVNTESWQSNDFKDVLTGSDEGDGSPDAVREEAQCRTGEDAGKLAEVSRAGSSSSGNELKPGKLHKASFSSINALIESCVKYADASPSLSAGDDVGMNLLASVAAGEMSKSDLILPTDSPKRKAPVVEDMCIIDDAKSKSSHGNNLAQDQSEPTDTAAANTEQGGTAVTPWTRDGLNHLAKQDSGDLTGNGKATSSTPELISNGRGDEHNSSNLDLQSSKEPCLEINEISDQLKGAAYLGVSPVSAAEKVLDAEESTQPDEKTAIATIASVDSIQDNKTKGSSSVLTGSKVNEELSSVQVEKAADEGSLYDKENKDNLNEGFSGGDHMEQKPPPLGKVESEHLERCNNEQLRHSSTKDLGNVDEHNGGKDDVTDVTNYGRQSGKQKVDQGNNVALANENQFLDNGDSTIGDQKREGLEVNVERKEVTECKSSSVGPQYNLPSSPGHEEEQQMRSRASKASALEADEAEESASITADDTSFPAAGVSNVDAKLKFDLNEGFVADDGKYGESINSGGPGCSASLRVVNPFPFPVSSLSSGLPASITVAAAAKGPFVPREDLLRSKGELGWKGSAATSAFRPAEPRKLLDIPPGTTNIPSADATAGKHGRPLLDFDLNVPDERIVEDMASQNSVQDIVSMSDRVTNLAQNKIGSTPIRSSGFLDLDLNRVDEASDTGPYLTSSSGRVEASLLPVKATPTSGFPDPEVRRDFDLNNGPVLDEVTAEPLLFGQHVPTIPTSMLFQPPAAGHRMNNAEMGTFSSWFTNPNAYPAVTIPSILSDRGEQPFAVATAGGPPRTLRPANGGPLFASDVYRGSVLSSSPAISFQSTPFQYPVFPYGATLPVPSAAFSGGSTTYMDPASGGRLCFPPANSQLIGPATIMSPTQYPRPSYVVSLPDGSSSISIDNNRKWGKKGGLDLNAGPGSLEIEGRDETSPLASRQLPVASSQALVEEQARMYQQVAGIVPKRKEPEGGWDTESFRYRQPSWQ
ncbi:uncharacterized protein LOC127789915 [Diospyros lotus]|uniref:uncharacterized protein LOC127789915 n=1 Tax=Diospyros lotus TaxID=55363 RepID=UPI00224D20EB|nr:uncharacterized protein LOC127789915 [Diospyros lotus]XP_052174969.1 uncharacterized protein LOC127789915 [Diospyros lotus]